MIYKFNDTDITTYGVLPVRGEGGVAVSGIFDLPKRTGDTERNWGDEVEPYVSEKDLTFGDRVIGLKLVMEDLADLERFRTACLECRKLGTELGDFNVIVSEEIKVEKIGAKMGMIEVKFRQNQVDFKELSVTGTEGTGFRVDNFNLERDFGIFVSEVKGDRDIPKRIEVSTSAPYLNTCYRENPTITLECVMMAGNLHEVKDRIEQLQALWIQPGFRILYFPDGRTKQVYVKEGFSVKIASDRIIMFSLKLEVYDKNI